MTRAALLQMTSGSDFQANADALAARMADVAEAEPQLVLAPENALCLGPPSLYRERAEPLGEGPMQEHAATLAREHGTWLLLGSAPIRSEDGAVHATSLLYDGEGKLQAHYEKQHLFDVEVPGDRAYRESEAYDHGSREVVVDTPLGKLGLSICYDLRFPQLYHQLRHAGAELLAVPAAFTRITGEAHWEVLLRARAIETQCFVLAPAQGGTHDDGRETWGHACAVDPWGRVLGVAAPGTGALVVDLDRAELDKVRSRMPVAEHRRYVPSPRG
jgi:predicted amidohydrolase